MVLDESGAKRVFQSWTDNKVFKTVLDGAQTAYYGVGYGTSDAASQPLDHGAGLVFQIKDDTRPTFGWVVVVQHGPASSEDLTAILVSVTLN